MVPDDEVQCVGERRTVKLMIGRGLDSFEGDSRKPESCPQCARPLSVRTRMCIYRGVGAGSLLTPTHSIRSLPGADNAFLGPTPAIMPITRDLADPNPR